MSHDHDAKGYRDLGVSATKDEVHAAIAGLPPGLLKHGFCRVNDDVFNGDPAYCVVSHADGAGTKSILAYLAYRLTGDASVFKGIAQDALVMNLDDMLCVGVTGGLVVASLVNRNARRVGGDVLRALVEGTQEFCDRMTRLGVRLVVAGGETADVGDVVKTILVDAVLTGRLERRALISCEPRPGDLIVGLASGGPAAAYEDAANSGIGCNGLTAARHALLNRGVAERFPEAYDETLDPGVVYRGPFAPDDRLPGTEFTVLRALLSPTRTFAPIIKDVLARHRADVSGIVHCTGGGQLKCLRFGQGTRFVKDLGPELPPLFRALKEQSDMSMAEMAKVFNLGYRMELYVRPEAAEGVMAIAHGFGVGARVIGRIEASASGHNEAVVTVAGETVTAP